VGAASSSGGRCEHLREYSIGLPQVLFQSITHMAPGAAVAYSIYISVPFARQGAGVSTVVAVDAAGRRSDVAASLRVSRVARPEALPRRVPRWAWRILAWQHAGRSGARPAAPRPLPAWYWAWKGWREQPVRPVG
jgi:hypothetical protein